MASITYDGQSFLIDGRRIWLVGGTINATLVPREHWAARIHQAKQAGLNTITTSVHWARHEARPGQFDFAGDADLRHFVTLVGQAGMYCVLRLGPYVGSGLDLGGLPPWLQQQKDVALRTSNAPYLEAASRFFGAVARQVRDLQVSAPSGAAGGPILLVQNESGWTCGHDGLATAYLGELNRYIRESGFEVPILNGNDLWSGVEGEIDTWTGSGELMPNLRQLATVRPLQPRIVSALRVGRPSVFGRAAGAPMSGEELQRTLGEVLAAGGQYNIEPFFAGTHHGFWAGRQAGAEGGWLTPGAVAGAPIDEAGRATALLEPLRRVSLFASRFARVLSAMEHRRFQVALRPATVARGRGHSVVHASGSQGSVAYVFGAPTPARSRQPEQPASLLLSDGTELPVYLGANPVAWCLLDVRLVGRSHLDYSNLSAIALVGRVLVVAGPAGTPARLSINGAPLELDVPEGGAPLVVDHEGVVVVVCADEQVPMVQVADDAVYLNAAGLTPAGVPIVAGKDQSCTRISDQGVRTELTPSVGGNAPARAGKGKHRGKLPAEAPPPPAVVVAASTRTPPAPAMERWEIAPAADYVSGGSARFATIAGPADLAALGAPFGYGWYRVQLKGGTPRRAHLAWPQGADRMHVFVDGTELGVLGEGPGARADLSMNLTKHPQTLVVLVENAGRFSGGNRLTEAKGLLGHAWEVEPLRLGRAALVRGEPMEPLAFRAPIFGVSEGDATDPARIAWSVNRRGKNPIVVTCGAVSCRGVMLVNGHPHRWFDAGEPWRAFLDESVLGRGNVELSVALLGSAEESLKELGEALGGSECVENLTAKAEWSFAKWERPGADAYKPYKVSKHGGPVWCRGWFSTRAGAPSLRVVCAGLSKGQVYVNGRHAGRYFTATGTGHEVGPPEGVFVPSAWLTHEKPNELMIFDEHGYGPSKVRLAFEV